MRHTLLVLAAALTVAACGDNLVGDQPPTISGRSVTTAEDTAVEFGLDATDPNGKPLTFTASAPAHGTITVAGDRLTYTPAADYNGADSAVVTVSDGTLTADATVTITVTPINDAPVAVDDTAAAAEDTAATITGAALVANDTDIDGDTLSVTAVADGTHGTVTLAGDTITFTPEANYNGDATFTYTVSDGTATDTGTVTVAVGGANDPPVAVDDTATTPEDTELVVAATTLLANDTDPENQTLSLTAVGNASHGTVSLTGGQVHFVPDANYSGPAAFDYTVSDGAASDTGTVAVTVTPVNDPPVATDDAVTTAEDTAATITAASLLANDTDLEGDTLTLTGVSGATNGTVALVGTTITFTPAANFNGTAGFDYTVNDGALADIGHVTVTVTAVNDPPVAVDDTRTTAEDTAATITAASLTANDTDVEGSPLTVTAVAGATGGTVALAGTTITFTPAANFNGTAGFDYTVSDGTATDVGHVTVTVTPVNDPPVAVADTVTTAEDTAATITAASLLANDSDPDGTPTVSAVSNATNGTVALAGTTITFTPAANFNGTAGFDYTITDGTLTATAHVTVTVTAVNDPPVAVADAVTTAEDTAATITAASLLANDSDPDGTPTVSAVSNATSGTVALAGTTITFTPAANFNGTAGFDYTITDGTLTATAHVTVTVTAVDDPPVAVADAVTTAEDTAATITAASLLANDTDPDSTPTVTAVSNATNGTVALVGTTVTFTPTANFNGTAGFDYTISDGTATSTAHVTVTVTAVNDPPVAVADSVTTAEDTAATITAASLLANDTDVEGATLTVTAVSGATSGTVALVGTTITFTPAANFNGTAGFDYTISDGTATATGHVTVTVTPVNDPPVATNKSGSTSQDTPVTFTDAVLLAGDTDVDGDTLSVVSVQGAVNGTVSRTGGVTTFTPAAGFTGLASFTYTITDGTVNVTASVTVSIGNVNDPPIAVDDAATTDEDTAATIAAATLLANDTDPDLDPLTVTAVASPTNGTVTLVGTTITFTPTANFNGIAGFDYTVTDGVLSDVGHVTVVVRAVNDPPVAVADTATTAEDTGLSLPGSTLTANDTDVDGDPLTVVSVDNPTNGSVLLVLGTVTFTPAANYFGPAGFDYTISDGTVTATAHVDVTVTSVNDLPVAVDDSGFTNEDLGIFVDVLVNDTGLGDGGISISIATPPAHGTATPGATNVLYVPQANYNGTDTFTYTITDANGDSATATVTINLNPINDPPVANSQSVNTNEGTPVTITLTATDIDSAGVTFAIATPPTHGTLGAITPAGAFSATVVFTPTVGYNGPDSFTFTASDGTDTSNVATVTLTIVHPIVCGDGVVEGSEGCDDHGVANNDGCSSTCAVETGWTCTGAPSTCTPICGDTLVRGSEQCDDGNVLDNDACTSQCVTARRCTSADVAGGVAYSQDPATGTCYVTFGGSTTWADAQTACLGLTGYLMTVTSASEQSRLHNALHVGTPWIGGSDQAVEGTFRWVTPEPFAFTAYAPGEPDDDVSVGGNGDCLAVTAADGTWGDTNCTFVGFTTGRICELPATPCGDGLVEGTEACDDGNRTGGDGCSATCTIETAFFSEYVEGTGNDKAIEIHNSTGAPLACSVGLYSNGSTTRSSITNITIPAHDEWVICNTTTGSPLIGNPACNQSVTGGVVNYNGDDALDLICGGVTVDVIGQIGFDPGTTWGTAPTTTLDATLRRKCTATAGDTVGNDPFVPATNWTGFPVDTTSDLGSYVCP